MKYEKMFKYLLIDANVGRSSRHGEMLDTLISAIKDNNYEIDAINNRIDAKFAIQQNIAYGCILLDIDTEETISGIEFIEYIHKRGLEIPIFIISEKDKTTELTSDILSAIRGVITPHEDTPVFVANYLRRAFHEYIDKLKTPFFGGMVDYVEAGNEMWLAPGHNGGMFYHRSPIGRIFFDYLGENFFRADFNFVPDLGGIFDHSGAYLKAEQDAAKIFNAERTYFVLNGTSTSNKIVNGSLITPGDLVLYDRNNHKSNLHSALILNGGIPIYLPCDRNPFGMVGPIDYNALDEEYIRSAIRDNPLVKDKDAWKKERPLRAVIIENCTYDGTIYNIKTIMEKIGHLSDYLFFDEAWGGFMRFHPLYNGRYAMQFDNLSPSDPGIIVTQSTHKQLAGVLKRTKKKNITRQK
jgi:hypothetical protein